MKQIRFFLSVMMLTMSAVVMAQTTVKGVLKDEAQQLKVYVQSLSLFYLSKGLQMPAEPLLHYQDPQMR